MPTIHVHWDSARGLSSAAILAACLGADPLEEDPWPWMLQERVLPCVFGGLFSRCILRLEKKEEMNTLALVYEITLVNDSKHLTFEKLDDLLAHANGISVWVRDHARAVLGELHSSGGVKADYAYETKEIVLVVGVLWSLERLLVDTFSCGPIPFALSSEGSPCPLPVDLPVQIVSRSALPHVDPIAVVLLRVLLRTFPSRMGHSPPMMLRKLSRGTCNTPVEHETCVVIGERFDEVLPEPSSPCDWSVHQMSLLEANIDDCTAEHLSFCVDRLLLQGAADVWLTPIVMKKGRAAHTLHCLCQLPQKDSFLREMFRHSTTLGVRVRNVDRVALQRKMITVQTKWTNNESNGVVHVKVAYMDGEVISVKSEFEDCKKISLATGEPILGITHDAERLARLKFECQD